MKPIFSVIIGVAYTIAANIANADGVVRTDFDFTGNPYSQQYQVEADLIVRVNGDERTATLRWDIDGTQAGNLQIVGPGIEFAESNQYTRDVRFSPGAYAIRSNFWGEGSQNEELIFGEPFVVDGVEHFGVSLVDLTISYDWPLHPSPGFDALGLRGRGWYDSVDGSSRLEFSIDCPRLTIQAVPEPSGGDLAITTAIATFLAAGPFGVRRR